MRSPRNALRPKSVPESYWLPLSKNLFALIDSEDIERVSKWLWSALVRKGPYSPYALRRQEGRTIYLHRFIMNAPEGLDVDHKDGNGLNCKKSNLRLCTHAENQHNYSKTSRKTSSQYKGVHLSSRGWTSRIKNNGKIIHLGHFKSEREAAIAYDQAALEKFGEFSKFNFNQSCLL